MNRNDLDGAHWRKSSYSDGQANCVEVTAAGLVAVRDSKAPDGPSLAFAPSAWRQYIWRISSAR